MTLELNATQRLFEALTGRSMRLFRPPYLGDAEPTTADEIVPIEVAQTLGYITVGLHVDPDDWQRPSRRYDRSARHRSRSPIRIPTSGATSCCCTIPAATGARPSRRCRC